MEKSYKMQQMKVRTYVNKENLDQVELLIRIEEVAFNFIRFFSQF